MPEYVGIHTQIAKNNRLSFFFLIGFPLLVLLPVFLVTIALPFFMQEENGMAYTNDYDPYSTFLGITPIVLAIVGIWFLIAYSSHTSIIRNAAHSKSLQRKEHPEVYNLTENLCMSAGMKMPQLQIIESPALNAFASGINEKSFTVTLTRGIIEKLNKEELEGVIAHELMHIRNRDVRLLVISIIFVGIFAFASNIAFRMLIHGNRGRNNKNSGAIVIVAFIAILISYLLSVLFKFGLSRKREYMADAGASDMTKNPRALASALRKISGNHEVEDVNDELKQMFIANNPKNPKFSIASLFKTHPPIEKRIAVLENF